MLAGLRKLNFVCLASGYAMLAMLSSANQLVQKTTRARRLNRPRCSRYVKEWHRSCGANKATPSCRFGCERRNRVRQSGMRRQLIRRDAHAHCSRRHVARWRVNAFGQAILWSAHFCSRLCIMLWTAVRL
uniref:Secreted protein n=1 Tax=Rhipicephalus zambeziensis TaxID=60191 RepID=A0A224Y5D1_9ACAR